MTIKDLKDKISANGSFKIKVDKFLEKKFGFKERISSKMEADINAFNKELSDNGIKMTLSGKTKTSLLDFKDGNKFSQITFSLVAEKATIDNENRGIITVEGNNTKALRPYQSKAISQLNDALKEKPNNFSGLLVIPTGGGKTFIATYWMLKHKVNKDVKVLWLAHRHSLLDQAFETIFNTCTKDVLDTKDKVSYHIISGAHENTSDIRKETDIIIAGKDSFQNLGLTRLIDNWAKHQAEILIVVDEAHHAPAKTYRNIIDRIKACKGLKVNVLGLTATPIRTAKKEQGLIEKMFPDQHIDGGIDLKKLINTNVLAKPRFKECEEKFVFDGDLSNEQIKTIEAFDKLPKELAEKIVKNAPRNNAILKEYKKGEYGKTIIFAIDQDHATTLQGLFKGYLGEDKVATVISGVRAGVTKTNISREANQRAIEEFRKPNSKLEVLINVNILTEGVDIPDVRSIFLTRPTTSTILMTQMIGRGLRISEGKTECKIVSFIVDFGNHGFFTNVML